MAVVRWLHAVIATLRCHQEDIDRLTQDMVQSFGRHKHIANLGHGIYPDMDPEHLAVFLQAVHRHSKTQAQAQA